MTVARIVPWSVFGWFGRCKAAWFIHRSCQFDTTYYVDTYGAQMRLPASPLLDYVWYGARAGRAPCSTFSAGEWRTRRNLEGHSDLECFLDYLESGNEHPLALWPVADLRRHLLLVAREVMQLARHRSYARLLRESGFLDEAYYLRTYPDAAHGKRTALDDYVAAGLREGRYPNADFDPIAYLLKYRDAGNSLDPPVIHYLQVGRRRGYTAPHGLGDVLLQYVPDSHHKLQVVQGAPAENRAATHGSAPAPGNGGARGRKPRRQVAGEFGKGRPRDADWSYTLADSKSHLVDVRRPEWYFERIACGEPLAFIKRTHGTWDILATWEDNCRRLRNLPLSRVQQRHLASRLSLFRYGSMKRDVVRYLYVDNFQHELADDICYVTRDPNYCHAIALSGLPVSPRRQTFVLYSKAYARKLRSVLCRLLPPGRYHDATIWKWAVCTGAATTLNDLMKERPVFFVGLHEYVYLGERLGLRSYTHVQIPSAGAMQDRAGLLERLLGEIRSRCGQDLRNVEHRPIVLICAGNLAQWLVHRLYLHAPGGVYLDVGLAWVPWLLDVYPIEQGWIRQIPPQVAVDLGLLPLLQAGAPERQEFYRPLLDSIRAMDGATASQGPIAATGTVSRYGDDRNR